MEVSMLKKSLEAVFSYNGNFHAIEIFIVKQFLSFRAIMSWQLYKYVHDPYFYFLASHSPNCIDAHVVINMLCKVQALVVSLLQYFCTHFAKAYLWAHNLNLVKNLRCSCVKNDAEFRSQSCICLLSWHLQILWPDWVLWVLVKSAIMFIRFYHKNYRTIGEIVIRAYLLCPSNIVPYTRHWVCLWLAVRHWQKMNTWIDVLVSWCWYEMVVDPSAYLWFYEKMFWEWRWIMIVDRLNVYAAQSSYWLWLHSFYGPRCPLSEKGR